MDLRLDLLAQSLDLPDTARTAYQRDRAKLMSNLNFILAEIALQETSGKTFLGTGSLDPKMIKEALAAKDDLQGLIKVYTSFSNKLQDAKTLETPATLKEHLSFGLEDLSETEFHAFLVAEPHLAARAGGPKLLVATHVLNLWSRNLSDKTLEKRTETVLKDILSTGTRDEVYSMLWHFYQLEGLEAFRDQVLKDPKVKRHLKTLLDYRHLFTVVEDISDAPDLIVSEAFRRFKSGK